MSAGEKMTQAAYHFIEGTVYFDEPPWVKVFGASILQNSRMMARIRRAALSQLGLEQAKARGMVATYVSEFCAIPRISRK